MDTDKVFVHFWLYLMFVILDSKICAFLCILFIFLFLEGFVHFKICCLFFCFPPPGGAKIQTVVLIHDQSFLVLFFFFEMKAPVAPFTMIFF